MEMIDLRPTERPREQVVDPEAIEIGDGTSLDLLQAVYRNSAIPLSVRMRAASMALPFEHPKLSVGVAVGIDPDWPRRMELLWQRTRGAQLIEAQPVGLVMRR